MASETTTASGVRAAAEYVIGRDGRGVHGGRPASAKAQRSHRLWAVLSEQQGNLLTHKHSCPMQKQVVRDAGKENFPVV